MMGAMTSGGSTRRAGLGAIVALLALSACGGGSAATRTVTLSDTTGGGLSYALHVTETGKQQCVTASYEMVVASHPPVVQGSHLCGPAAQPGHPILVQAQGSAESLLADVSATGCGAVRGGSTSTALQPLVSRCSPSGSGKTEFRATILPKARRLYLSGVAGVPVINFPRHVCHRGVCVTPLA
jgi:hypothetical protein